MDKRQDRFCSGKVIYRFLFYFASMIFKLGVFVGSGFCGKNSQGRVGKGNQRKESNYMRRLSFLIS
jgi:hypothetical protein